MRSMAVLSSRAHERRSRETNKNCSRPNLLAVTLPSTAFITLIVRSTKTAMLRRLGLMLLFVLEVKKCFTRRSQKVLAFLWLISFRYGFFCFLALSAITNILHEPRDKSREIPWDNIDSRAWQTLACEQALLFERVKRVSRERASERRSRERLASLAQIGELARRLGKLLARKQGKLYS